MRRSSFLPMLLASVLLAACTGPAEFRLPISEPGAAAYDEALVGSWYAFSKEHDGVVMLRIAADAEGRLVAAAGLIELKPGTDGRAAFQWLNREAYPSEIDGVTYFNTRPIAPGAAGFRQKSRQAPEIESVLGGAERGYWIMRAEIDADDRLTLEVLSEKVPNRLDLPGREMSCGEDCTYEILDLSSAELIALIRSNPPEDLFSIRIGPLARVGAGAPVLKD